MFNGVGRIVFFGGLYCRRVSGVGGGFMRDVHDHGFVFSS